ncbi:MAG: N-6 DNA methylase [Odoribacter sp.]
MELKELTQKVLAILDIKGVESFTDGVRKCVFSQNRNIIFDKYIELCPDLSLDWMQHIYQFYCADRNEKKQDYTPLSLSRLISFLTRDMEQKTVYDCCTGSGSLLIQKWNIDRNLQFICEEIDENVIPVLLFNLCIRNIEAIVINKNILTGESFCSYKTIKGDKYSSVQCSMFTEEFINADVSISNPPFNLKNIHIIEHISKELPKMHSCNFAFVENCLQRSKRYCALILPCNILTSSDDALCRKHYIQKGWLKAAISLPGKMFESTSVSSCILVFDKKKTIPDVMLVNAEEMKSIIVREQRGEGDASHYNRIYKKEFNTFSDDQIIAICELVNKEQDRYSKLITIEEAEINDYNLSISRYQQQEIGSVIHRDFNTIISEINHIIRERNVIKLTVNKVWAERLGLVDVINNCEASNELAKSLNVSFSKFKNYRVREKIIENKYIQSSNSKVFSIENTDKEVLSTIMPVFIGMYKQHIFYLNNEENRLLAELRDSMCPLLMNGELLTIE